MYALPQRQRPVGHDKLLVEVVQLTEAGACRTRAERRVEGERPRLQLIERYAAVHACVELGVCSVVDVDDARALLERQLDGVCEARPVAGQHEAVHDDVDVVGPLLVQLRQLVDGVRLAVDANPRKAIAPYRGEGLLVAALLALHDRRVDDDAPFALHYRVYDLLGRLAANLPAALRTVGRSHRAVEHPEVVVNLGDRRDDRPWVAARRVLLDGYRGAEAFDLVDLGLAQAVEELPGVGRQRFDVTALPFGVERVERKG